MIKLVLKPHNYVLISFSLIDSCDVSFCHISNLICNSLKNCEDGVCLVKFAHE
jgi:hypothetical protein